jgi:methyl-accepting chemotaxis protein
MILEIGVLILSISVFILVVFLIPTIIQIKRSALGVEESSKILNAQLPNIVQNINQMSESLNEIISSGRQQTETLSQVTREIKLMVDNIVDFERDLQKRIEEPLLETVSTLAAITKAVRTFIIILFDKK